MSLEVLGIAEARVVLGREQGARDPLLEDLGAPVVVEPWLRDFFLGGGGAQEGVGGTGNVEVDLDWRGSQCDVCIVMDLNVQLMTWSWRLPTEKESGMALTLPEYKAHALVVAWIAVPYPSCLGSQYPPWRYPEAETRTSMVPSSWKI